MITLEHKKQVRVKWLKEHPLAIATACKKWRSKNEEEIRKYNLSPKRRAGRAKWGRDWYKDNPELAKMRAKLAHNPIRSRAGGKLNWAVRSGKIKRLPCEVCGEVKTEAHHPDYSKPLDVKWLCKLCHEAEHIKLRRGDDINSKIGEL